MANFELLIRLLLANGLEECDDAVARIQTLRADRDAARDAALEEAAKVAEKYTECCQSCAGVGFRIRALKGKSHE